MLRNFKGKSVKKNSIKKGARDHFSSTCQTFVFDQEQLTTIISQLTILNKSYSQTIG